MPRRAITANTLFYGDNLDILREYVADETIDLVYLDPPFNSSRAFSMPLRDEAGMDSVAQPVRQNDGEQLGLDVS